MHFSKNAVFSNLPGLKKALMSVPMGCNVTVDFSNAKMVDQTTPETLKAIKDNLANEGGSMVNEGLHSHRAMPHDETSTRVKKTYN
ncbi:MAG: hypothetical protein IAF38_19055 [Bacteroidia bacterium]|nr:hypothetical protein [Bacteroidia bacterium]